jgi:hypothetical protein
MEWLDPNEDGFAKTSNVMGFLAGPLSYGVPNADLFLCDDLSEATGESQEEWPEQPLHCLSLMSLFHSL